MRRLALTASLASLLLFAAPSALAAPARQAVSGAIQAAPQLKLPPTAFPPAGFTVTAAAPVDANTADTTTIQAETHSTSYHDLGMLGGYYQEAAKSLLAGGSFYVTYLGSYYSSPDQAKNAFNNAAGGWTSHSPALCSFGEQCAQVSFTPADNNGNPLTINGQLVMGTFRMILKSNSIFEAGIVIDQGDFNAQQATGNQYLDTLSNAYLALFTAPAPTPIPPANPPPSPVTPTPTPTPSPTPVTTPTPTPTPAATNFTVDRVSVHKDTSDSSKALRQVKKGQAVYIFIDWTLNNAPANAKPHYAFAAKLKGRTLRRGAFTGSLSSYPPGGYYSAFPTKFKKIGTYTIAGTITLAGQTHRKTAKVKVVK